MRDHDHGGAAAHVVQHAEEARGARAVQSLQGLIEEQQLGHAD